MNLLVVHQGLRWALAVGHPRVRALRRFECNADVLAKLRVLDEPPHVGVGRDRPGGISGFRASALCPHGSPQIVSRVQRGDYPGSDFASPRPLRGCISYERALVRLAGFPSRARLDATPSLSRATPSTSPMSSA